jgi:hypothetical protein
MSLPILRTTELACQALATASLFSASVAGLVVTGIDNEDKSAPLVVCYAENATEDFPYSGIYHVATTIVCKEIAFDTDVINTELSDTIFQNFLSSSTIPALNTYPGYFVYNILVTDTKDSWQGDAHRQEYVLDILCALSGSVY